MAAMWDTPQALRLPKHFLYATSRPGVKRRAGQERVWPTRGGALIRVVYQGSTSGVSMMPLEPIQPLSSLSVSGHSFLLLACYTLIK